MSTIALDNGVLYSRSLQATFFTNAKPRGGSFGPTSSIKTVFGQQHGEVAQWGAANSLPQDVVAEINDSDILRPLIRSMALKLCGQGLVYGTTTIDPATGEERMIPMRVREIDEALGEEGTNADLYLYESAIDWFTFGNVFAELQTSYAGNIVGLYCQDATRCRLSTKDATGHIRHCYIDGDWNGRNAPRKQTIKLPALDPYYRPAAQMRDSKPPRAILPLRLLIDDNDYYGQAPWHGLITSGWLQVAKSIPKLKSHLMKNMMLIRYHIEVDEQYWPDKYKGTWEKANPDERKKIKQQEVDAFTAWAVGEENAGRSILSALKFDPHKGQQYSLWKITPLKLEIPTGAYVEDSQEADFHIVRAFMDPSLFGIAPGKDRNSAGSGSDKRIAHTHHTLDHFMDAQLLLLPLRVMASVNGWHDRFGNGQMLKFWFKSYHAATLDRTLGAISPTPPKPAPDAPAENNG